jgi:hypothetical protein
MKRWLLEKWNVLKRLAIQGCVPFGLAVAYAFWDYYTAVPEGRTTANWVKSFGLAFFFLMWLLAQWLRTSKQLLDAEHQSTTHELLHQLNERVAAFSAERPPAIGPATPAPRENVPATEDVVHRILDEVPKSPHGALLLLGAALERALRELLWGSGWHQGLEKFSVTNAIAHLEKLGVIAPNLGEARSRRS